jgi:phosphatidylserine decarboxylase
MRLDPAGWPFVASVAAATLIVAVWHAGYAIIPALLLLFCLNFFRDPERKTPSDPGALISPADGRIIRADAQRISIFMNVFDVHVCRAPATGQVAAVEHVPGRFLAAMKDGASEQNERTSITLMAGGVPVRFTLVAGLIARRIVCRVRAGQALGIGDRIGIIRFGSRVDVDLPAGAAPAVAIGQRVVAGESSIARLAPARG